MVFFKIYDTRTGELKGYSYPVETAIAIVNINPGTYTFEPCDGAECTGLKQVYEGDFK